MGYLEHERLRKLQLLRGDPVMGAPGVPLGKQLQHKHPLASLNSKNVKCTFKNFTSGLHNAGCFFQGGESFCVIISGRQSSHANDLERIRKLGGIQIRQSKKEGDQAYDKLQACIICAIIWHSFLAERS